MSNRRRGAAAASTAKPPIMRTFQVYIQGNPQRVTITRQRLYASGHEDRELVGSYPSPAKAAEAMSQLLHAE